MNAKSTVVLLSFCVVAVTAPSLGEEVRWSNTAGGQFDAEENWSTLRRPGPGDVAVFDTASEDGACELFTLKGDSCDPTPRSNHQSRCYQVTARSDVVLHGIVVGNDALEFRQQADRLELGSLVLAGAEASERALFDLKGDSETTGRLGAVEVGARGTGVLFIVDGDLSADSCVAGGQGGSVGVVEISTKSRQPFRVRSAVVGEAGNGKMTITGDGRSTPEGALPAELIVGKERGSCGTVLVSGRYVLHGTAVVGGQGRGTLSVDGEFNRDAPREWDVLLAEGPESEAELRIAGTLAAGEIRSGEGRVEVDVVRGGTLLCDGTVDTRGSRGGALRVIGIPQQAQESKVDAGALVLSDEVLVGPLGVIEAGVIECRDLAGVGTLAATETDLVPSGSRVIVLGSVSPGDAEAGSPGTLCVKGDLWFVDADLEIEVRGSRGQVQSFDQLDVEGSVDVSGSGSIQLVLPDGFEPDFGETIQVVKSHGLSGRFGGTREIRIDDARSFYPVYEPSGLTLVVPWLLGPGMGGFSFSLQKSGEDRRTWFRVRRQSILDERVALTLTSRDDELRVAVYTRWGQLPSPGSFSRSARSSGGRLGLVEDVAGRQEDLFVLVQNEGKTSDLDIRVENLPGSRLELSRVTPSEFGAGARRATVEVLGSGFVDGTTVFALRRDDGSEIAPQPQRTVILSSRRAVLTFDFSEVVFSEKDSGIFFSFVVRNGPVTEVFEDALKVVESAQQSSLLRVSVRNTRIRKRESTGVVVSFDNPTGREHWAPLFRLSESSRARIDARPWGDFREEVAVFAGNHKAGVGAALSPGSELELIVPIKKENEVPGALRVHEFVPGGPLGEVPWESLERVVQDDPAVTEGLVGLLPCVLGETWGEVMERLGVIATRLGARGEDTLPVTTLLRFAARLARRCENPAVWPVGAVAGRVTDSTGDSVGGARVVAVDTDNPQPLVRSEASTASDGTFVLDWLEAESNYEIYVVGHRVVYADCRSCVPISPSFTVRIPEGGDDRCSSCSWDFRSLVTGDILDTFVVVEPADPQTGTRFDAQLNQPVEQLPSTPFLFLNSLEEVQSKFVLRNETGLTVVSVWDPNDKDDDSGDEGDIDFGVAIDRGLTYKVRFENVPVEGNAEPGDVRRVVIEDRLCASILDLDTFCPQTLEFNGQCLVFDSPCGSGGPLLSSRRGCQLIGENDEVFIGHPERDDLKVRIRLERPTESAPIRLEIDTLFPRTSGGQTVYVSALGCQDCTHSRFTRLFVCASGSVPPCQRERGFLPPSSEGSFTFRIKPRADVFSQADPDGDGEVIAPNLAWITFDEELRMPACRPGFVGPPPPDDLDDPCEDGFPASPKGNGADHCEVRTVLKRCRSPEVPELQSPACGESVDPEKGMLRWTATGERVLRDVTVWEATPELATGACAGEARLNVEDAIVAFESVSGPELSLPPLASNRHYVWQVVAQNPSRWCKDDPARATASPLRSFDTFAAAFQRGDVDGNGTLQVTDAIRGLEFLFLGGEQPSCLDALDFDDSGETNISDPIGILSFLFLGGAPSPPPGSSACGIDPTADGLTCQDYPSAACRSAP